MAGAEVLTIHKALAGRFVTVYLSSN